jgi:hypothetical protein
MTTPEELAKIIHDTLHDRVENGTRTQLAFEAASLRGFIISTLGSLDHIKDHVEKNEIRTPAEMTAIINHLINRITTSINNLDDVRAELATHTPRRAHDDF